MPMTHTRTHPVRRRVLTSGASRIGVLTPPCRALCVICMRRDPSNPYFYLELRVLPIRKHSRQSWFWRLRIIDPNAHAAGSGGGRFRGGFGGTQFHWYCIPATSAVQFIWRALWPYGAIPPSFCRTRSCQGTVARQRLQRRFTKPTLGYVALCPVEAGTIEPVALTGPRPHILERACHPL